MASRNNVAFSKLAEDVVVIAVMGMTGSGKSSFIQKLTGARDIEIGNKLASCTVKPKLFEFFHNGTKIIMIDTPGFDDTFRTDADVLQDIATCLNLTYEANMRLTGIIYLHRIIDPRMTHGGMRNLAMFRKLCGSDPMKNVVLATTFWGQVDSAIAKGRENELRTDPNYWAEMIAEGARMDQFENTRDSALRLVLELMPKGRISLDIQKQMCDEGLKLEQTPAGVALNAELEEIAKKHAEEMQKLQKEMADALKAQDTKLHATLQRQSTKYEKKLNDVHAQQEVLKENRRNELRIMEQEFDKRLRRMETERQEEADERLKLAVAQARKDERANTSNGTSPSSGKKKDVVKYVKIGAAVLTATVSVAGCIINPMMAPHAVTSFIHLVNAFFDGSDTSTGDYTDTGGQDIGFVDDNSVDGT